VIQGGYLHKSDSFNLICSRTNPNCDDLVMYWGTLGRKWRVHVL
jgi:hypothetical protein